MHVIMTKSLYKYGIDDFLKPYSFKEKMRLWDGVKLQNYFYGSRHHYFEYYHKHQRIKWGNDKTVYISRISLKEIEKQYLKEMAALERSIWK